MDHPFMTSLRNHRDSAWKQQRANRILGMIKRTIVSREQDVVLRLYGEAASGVLCTGLESILETRH